MLLIILVCAVFAAYVYANRAWCVAIASKMAGRILGKPRHARLQNPAHQASAWKSATAGDDYSAFRAQGGDPVDWLSFKRGCAESDLH
jgi:hypothetical protein